MSFRISSRPTKTGGGDFSPSAKMNLPISAGLNVMDMRSFSPALSIMPDGPDQGKPVSLRFTASGCVWHGTMLFSLRLHEERNGIMHSEISKHKDAIEGICRRHDVALLEIFGSGARGVDFDTERSDVDLLVTFDPPVPDDLLDRWCSMIDDLEEVLGRDIQLIRHGVIENRYRLATIERDKETVYEI